MVGSGGAVVAGGGGGDRSISRARNTRRTGQAPWLILAGGRCRAGETSSPATAETAGGDRGVAFDPDRGGRVGCSSASGASHGRSRRMTGRWRLTTAPVSAGCLPLASVCGERRCSGQGVGVGFGPRAKGSHSPSSSPVSRQGTERRGRREVQKAGSMLLLLKSLSPWAVAAAAAQSGVAVGAVVPECSAHAAGHMGRDSREAEPYRPAGDDGQTREEQSRRQQTFGESSTSSPRTDGKSDFEFCKLCQPSLVPESGRDGAGLTGQEAVRCWHPAVTDTNPAAGSWVGMQNSVSLGDTERYRLAAYTSQNVAL